MMFSRQNVSLYETKIQEKMQIIENINTELKSVWKVFSDGYASSHGDSGCSQDF